LYYIKATFQTFCQSELVLYWVLVFAKAAMVSLSLKSLKEIMKVIVDCPGFDRVLNKVGVFIKFSDSPRQTTI